MQTPLQVLSARPKEAVLFMEGQNNWGNSKDGMNACVSSNQERCVFPLACEGTQGHARIHKHTVANVKMYRLCMTNPNISVCCAEWTTLLPFLPKWIKEWISVQGPGPFTWDWCLSIWCVKIIYINLPRPSVSCTLLKPSASAECLQHTHTALTEVNRLAKSQSEHCLSLTHSLPLLFLSYIFPGTVTLPSKLLTQQTLLRCGCFTTPASAERSALSQPISFQWGPAPLWSGHYHKLIHKLVR